MAGRPPDRRPTATRKTHMSAHPLHAKGLASLLTTFSFLVMSLSGVLLFIVPQGRIADWTDWTMLGLSKSQWGDIHITTSLMFLLAGAWHIWLNWRTLLNYFTAKRESGLMMGRELALSGVATAFVIAGAVYQVPPLSYVLTLNDAIKQAWIADKDHEPPIGHAELLTMPSFAQKQQMDLDQVTATLATHGIRFRDTEPLGTIARNHGITPVALYKLIRPLEGSAARAASSPPATQPSPLTASPAAPAHATTTPAAGAVYTPELVDQKFEGRGMGRKTLPVLADEIGFDLGRAREKLAVSKLVIKDDEALKDAAARAGMAPMEILKIILVGEPVRP
jgi:hypothetical protein